MIKHCERCDKQFDGYHTAKYCLDCRAVVQRELARECRKRYQQKHRGEKPVIKTVEKLRPLTKADLHQLLTLIRDAYQAGWLILTFGGQSALPDEQLAVVEQKYPNHSRNLGELRKQKFFDAVDKFIEAYQTFTGV